MARSKKKRKKKNGLNLSVIIMFILSILFLILIYTNSGYIGEHLSPMLGGIMGWIKYIIPIGMFLITIHMVSKDKEYLVSKLIQYVILLMCITSTITIFQISKKNLNLNDEFTEIVSQAYELGEKNIGGGAIGAIVAVPLAKLLGMLGAVIVSIGVAVILTIFIFGIQPAEIFDLIMQKIKENKKQRIEYEDDEEDEEEVKSLKKLKRSKKEEKREILPIDEDQITINFNENKKGLKKYDHSKDDIDIPLSYEEKNNVKLKPEENKDNIEENLFKTVEEKKEDKTKQEMVFEHLPLEEEDENYEFPPMDILTQGEGRTLKGGKKAITDNAAKLQKTLYSFGVSAKVENVSIGPAITRYELKPAEGVRVSKIANLADDIALNLAATSIRIEAPIPGKQAVGIEVPNKENEVVHLREILESTKFQDSPSKLAFALGKDVAGEEIVTDIAKMPHVLIAGSTGSGKSVCINTLVTSILYKAKPNEVKLVMVDPKVVELSVYNGIPHLLIPVVTDPKKAAGALAWAVQEMVNRYSLFAQKGVRDIKGYNEAIEKEEGTGKLPQIVIIIDELADLMMVAAKDVEDAICRLAQMARAAGMHLVIATQRPSVDVITGIIKANIPSRIAFAVSSQVDSRTILDMVGAEKLLGKGDMLFYPTGASKPTRVQGAFVSDKEVEKLVEFLKKDGVASYNEDILESIEKANSTDKEIDEQDNDDDSDPFLPEAIETVIETGQASTSFIQRRFKVGYARAGRIMDQMEARGIISGYEGSKPRQVLMSKERWAELKMAPSTTNEVSKEE